MPAPLTIARLALLFATTATLVQQEPRDPSLKAPQLILTGRVERVYTSEKQLPNDEADVRYAVEVILTVSKGDEFPAGKTIFVKTARLAKRAGGVEDPTQKVEIPGPGDIIEFTLSGGAGTTDEGLRIVVPGSCKSDSVGRLSKKSYG